MTPVDVLAPLAACSAALAALVWYSWAWREAPRQLTDQDRLQGTWVLSGALFGPEAGPDPDLAEGRRMVVRGGELFFGGARRIRLDPSARAIDLEEIGAETRGRYLLSAGQLSLALAPPNENRRPASVAAPEMADVLLTFNREAVGANAFT